MTTPPGAHGGAGCPNLLQRPRSSRDAGRGSLIFRASSRGRSRPGAPLQQIWTNPRPRPSQEPHTHHRDPLNPCSGRRRSRRCTAAAISPGLRGAEVRKAHPHSSLHSHYYQQYRHWRTVALYCHGPVARQGVRSCESESRGSQNGAMAPFSVRATTRKALKSTREPPFRAAGRRPRAPRGRLPAGRPPCSPACRRLRRESGGEDGSAGRRCHGGSQLR